MSDSVAKTAKMSKFYIGIDLGGTRIKIGLVRENELVAKKIIPANPSGGLKNSLGSITNEINTLLLSNGVEKKLFDGIGLGFPGLVDTLSKRILSTNKEYHDALTVDLNKWVLDSWGVSFYIDNDARMAAVGEWKMGAAVDTDNFVSVTFGTGVGTAVVMDGKLLLGKHFQAGCLGGHLSVIYGRNLVLVKKIL